MLLNACFILLNINTHSIRYLNASTDNKWNESTANKWTQRNQARNRKQQLQNPRSPMFIFINKSLLF